MKNWPRNLNSPWSIAGFTICAALVAVTQVRAESMATTVTHIDGHIVVGRLMALTHSQVQLATDVGRQMLDVEDVLSMTMVTTPGQPIGNVTVYLADGGRIYAELVDSAEDAIVVRSLWGESIKLSFDSLAGVQFAASDKFTEAAKLFSDALDKPLPGHDVLITRSKDKPRVMRGRLASLRKMDGQFVFGDRQRAFKNEKMFGIVFAGSNQRDKSTGVRVHLVDGSYVFGHIMRADEHQLWLDTHVAGQLSVPIDRVRLIKFSSRRITYLSDLAPLDEKNEGRIHRPWPIRRDRNVAMGPLRLGGADFEKGLGVHSRSRISFDVNRSYDRFVSTIGLDDSVTPRGIVVFQVLGDEMVLFDSGLMRGTDQPKLVNVDISNVAILTLLVDYGDELDLADHADWAGARLIKKPDRLESGINTQ